MRFGLPSAAAVTAEVFDVAGHRVVSRRLPRVAAGWRTWSFDGRDDTGDPLPSGLYFYRVATAGTRSMATSAVRKVVIEH